MNFRDDTHILQTQLKKYSAQDIYPFHMPGHKRLVQPAPGLPADWDVTEVPGTDDLHDADGILLEAMKRTASLCGADRTWYLVNGSTCGLLAGIRALARRGSQVICARNCHKAVFHAIELSGYKVHWIMPHVDESWGICGGITAGQVRQALKKHPSAKAVILTSPTYEGVLSDIAGICEICHQYGIPVLVDEAHGAHLMPASLPAGFPAGALAGDADLTVQSPHKTLPSLTQTALLHLRGKLVDPENVEKELDIFETSSPSYPLMASLDGCTGILTKNGEELFEKWADRIGRFDKKVRAGLQYLRVLGHTDHPFASGICDPGKVLIDSAPLALSGEKMSSILREKYRMETEMSQGGLTLAMTSICDEEDALDRLADALIEIETDFISAGNVKTPPQTKIPLQTEKPSRMRTPSQPETPLQPEKPSRTRTPSQSETPPQKLPPLQTKKEQSSCRGKKRQKGFPCLLASLKPVAHCTIAQAVCQESEKIALTSAAGRICAEYLYFYPPGIPILAPGEIITEKLVGILEESERDGSRLYRHSRGSMTISCLRE